jgi:hypothetical protein
MNIPSLALPNSPLKNLDGLKAQYISYLGIGILFASEKEVQQ